MKAEKIRNLTEDELNHQELNLADQLFKLKFQMNMGQTESLKKVRGLRRDIARVQTVRREQELAGQKNGTQPETTVRAETKEKVKPEPKAKLKMKTKTTTTTKKTKTEKK